MNSVEYRHDSFFGFLNYYRYRSSARILKRRRRIELVKPYPSVAKYLTPIMVLENLNIADFGHFIFFISFATLFRRQLTRSWCLNSLAEQNIKENFLIAISVTLGLWKAIKASRLRLKGILPNGLPQKTSDEPLKYDFSSEILSKTFWSSYFVLNLPSTF